MPKATKKKAVVVNIKLPGTDAMWLMTFLTDYNTSPRDRLRLIFGSKPISTAMERDMGYVRLYENDTINRLKDSLEKVFKDKGRDCIAEFFKSRGWTIDLRAKGRANSIPVQTTGDPTDTTRDNRR